MIELKNTHIGLTAIDAMMSGEVLRNSAPISCAVACRIYHTPSIMERLVSTIMGLTVFVLTCTAAAGQAIAMFGKTFERKHLMTHTTFLHVEDRSTQECQQYCTQ